MNALATVTEHWMAFQRTFWILVSVGAFIALIMYAKGSKL